MTQSFPITGFLILCYIFIRYLLDTSSEDKPQAAPESDAEPESKRFINYISNGKVIEGCHFYYYVDMINLTEAERIDEDIIADAARKRRLLINTVDDGNDCPVSTADIKAAKEYLLDRWFYMTGFN